MCHRCWQNRVDLLPFHRELGMFSRFTKSVLSANLILPLKCSDLAHIPSFLVLNVLSIILLSDEESSIFFVPHFDMLFSFHFIAESAIEFLGFTSKTRVDEGNTRCY